MSDQGMSMPGPEHEQLKPFEGKFRARVRIWMGPGDPMVSTGMMENTMDLGGRFLCQTYTGDPSEGPFPKFEGRGFWGYNQISKQYEGVWIDNASSVMQTEVGTVDASGKVWTMSGSVPDPHTGGTMTKRSVITLQDDDHHRMEMFFVKDGKESKCMDIEYART